jgi:hypothetical protein
MDSEEVIEDQIDEQLTTLRCTREELARELWIRGELSWLLKPRQVPIYNAIRSLFDDPDPENSSFVIDCSRQYGKSFTGFLTLVEDAFRNKRITMLFVAQLKSQVNEIITGETYHQIFNNKWLPCPQDLLPKMDGNVMEFSSTNSRIKLGGTDNKNYESIRGGAAHRIIFDEAGFHSHLTTGVMPALLPMTTRTNGKALYMSTPPVVLDHDYYNVLRTHEEEGKIITFTIWDDPYLTDEDVQKAVKISGGQETTMFKREYECKRIADTSLQVIPELTPEAYKAVLLDNSEYKYDELYQYWHKYVVADWGGKDFTSVIFGHYNYRERRFITEKRIHFVGTEVSSGVIGKGVKDIVDHLWPKDIHKNIRYICDTNNPLIQNTMLIDYKMPFVGVRKYELEQMVQKLRNWINDDRMRWDPEAVFALKSCQAGYWSKHKDKFAKSEVYGHYDDLAATIYAIISVDERTNPVPVLLNIDPHKQYVSKKMSDESRKNQNQLRNIFRKPS